MAEHVAQLTSAGKLLDLAPPEIARAPILQATRTIMIGLAEITLSDEVGKVAHRRDEPVGKRRHVADTGANSGIGH